VRDLSVVPLSIEISLELGTWNFHVSDVLPYLVLMRPLPALALLLVTASLYSQNPVFVLNPSGHSGRIQGILQMPDGQMLITFGADKSICIWDVATGKLLRKKWLDMGTGDNGRFIDMDLVPKSGVIALARVNGEGKPVVNLIDVLADRILGTYEGFSHDLGFVRVDPRGQFIITGPVIADRSTSEPLRLWKMPVIQATPFKINKAIAQAGGFTMHDFVFYNNGDDFMIRATVGDDIAFHVHRDPSAIPEFSLKKVPLLLKDPGHSAYSTVSGKVFSITHDGQVTLVDVSGEKETLSPKRNGWGTDRSDSSSQHTEISPSGLHVVVTASVKADSGDFIEVYDLRTKKKAATLSGWHQAVRFISDTTIASETHMGFCTYNIVTGKNRVLQGPRGFVTDKISFGEGARVIFDNRRRVFDFGELELHDAGPEPAGFSSAKLTYHTKRLAEPNSLRLVLDVNDRPFYAFPWGPGYTTVSFLNDGRILSSRVGYRTYSHYLLIYDTERRILSSVYEPQASFETLGTTVSIAPHPELENSQFATRDQLGVVALFDAKGPSVPVFKSSIRVWPFVNLSLEKKGKGNKVYASPQDGYAGVLRKGDKIESMNGLRTENLESIIRYLEAVDPMVPVDVAVKRGDQTIHSPEKLNSIATYSPLLSFVPLENNEWLCWTPQGYYASSVDGEKWGGWVINKGVNAFAEFHPIYDFKKQFYKPELIKLIARHGSLEKAVREFNETAEQPLMISERLSEKLPPSVAWVSPAKDTTVSRARVRLSAAVQSASKVQSVKVLLNGRTILRRDQISIRQERDTPLYSVSFELDLLATDNTVNLFVENEFGTTISMERVLKMKQVETGMEKYKPNLYLLSVGVSKHSIPAYSLSFADNDAKGIDELYKSQQGLLFKNVFTKTLLNEQATRAGILEAFYWLEQNATQKDVVVIFMASHGLNDKDRFYILPYDGDPEKIRITGVDWSNFSDVLGNLPSKVLVFIDACHSGKLGTNVLAKRGDTDLMEAIRTLATEENGVVIMAASTGKESSLESPEWQHGAFTLALLEGLRDGKADLNTDGIINIREIDYYVAERVKTLTNGRQHPTTQKPSVVAEFPLMMMSH
jgi:hypothetical protein